MRMRDLRDAAGLPVGPRPAKPAVLLLVEHAQRLVAQLRELGPPSRPAAHRAVVNDGADDVDLLAVVDLVPQRLQHLSDRGAVGVPAVHQAREVLEAHVAGLQLLVIEHADAAAAGLGVPVEREVDFLDAVALGTGAELRFGAGGAAAEKNVVGLSHGRSPFAVSSKQ